MKRRISLLPGFVTVLVTCAIIVAVVLIGVLLTFQQGSQQLRKTADAQMAFRLSSVKHGAEGAMSGLLEELEGLSHQPYMVRILDHHPAF